MGKNSKIEWTHHTFNPWWGCVKVSQGCEHCYAETFSKRTGHAIWGPAKTTQRRTFGDKHWAEPLKWDADAAKAGERHRVFCASMADVFEEHPQLDTERRHLWDLIRETPHLDWMLLTKRPRNIADMVPGEWRTVGRWPANVWVGTSVENQEQAEQRIPALRWIPAPVKFLSCEPLLSPLALEDLAYEAAGYNRLVDWVIVGGESGPHARPMHPDWARSLRDQCQAAGISFHYKQHGAWLHRSQVPAHLRLDLAMANVFGHDFKYHEWSDGTESIRLPKTFAGTPIGRELDGRTWDEYPVANQGGTIE